MSVNYRDSDPKIVIEGEITDPSFGAYVRISKTSSFQSDTIHIPYDVTYVIISDNIGNMDTLDKFPRSKGLYYSPIKGEIGRTYYLKVIDGKKIYTAQSTMPKAPKIDTIYSASLITADNILPFIRFKDDKDETNYYRYFVRTSNPILSYVEEDKFFNGTTFELFPTKQYYKKGDKIEFVLCGIDEANFVYFKGLFQILAKPPSLVNTDNSAIKENPKSNIIGTNVLGYFSAHSVSSVNFVIQ